VSRTTIDHLTPEQIEQLGAEFDAIRQRVLDDLGETDASYIRRLVKVQRSLETSGRGLLFLGFLPPAWLAGVAALSLSKILDNMEIGHNVMHGQYDWMGDPTLRSEMFEWDNACPSEQWRYSHNFVHHTFTNVLGKDRDIGYGILRMAEDQSWHPYYLGNPIYAFWLAVLFEWGVAVHDVEVEQIVAGDRTWAEAADVMRATRRKGSRQVLKDYVLFPALAGPFAPIVLAGNLSANLVRNVWAFTIIFCGHFPDGTETFTEEEVENETRGGWYLRQMLGSANLTGGKLFHILSGNLSHQIEHHLFPDLPARRYEALSAEVREICTRYGLPYNSGRLSRQFGTVVRRIFRLALPSRRRPDPAPRTAAADEPAGRIAA
jgi:NADPH-dependent stearoyl-CoA 9-desaturase